MDGVMTIARTRTVRIGTDETTGITIATTANSETSEIDWPAGDAAMAEIILWLKFTSTVTAGTVDISVRTRQNTAGAAFGDKNPITLSYAPINGTQNIYVGRFWVPRYGTIRVLNNATGANITNVLVVEEKIVYS
jgi:hypothetical protein